MPCSGMVCLVAFVRIDVSEERSTSIIRVTTLAVINRSTLLRNGLMFNYLSTTKTMRTSGDIYVPFLAPALDGLAALLEGDVFPGRHWAPEPIWTLWNRENLLFFIGNRSPVVETVARDCTEPVPCNIEGVPYVE
jgi:hypothetical protein